ncbi:MAG TPA: RluA family pseudouridine synthase [Spirochaetota bacterium]|nr:RluA family pseudouridine synthase [Spirochaetota bacterium]HRX47906.1 RluA family pseudouridine synthase [Spirochaetota bacterium]
MNKLNIIHEDNHIIVADKPAGILTQGDYSGEESLLEMIKEYIRIKYNKPGEAFIGLVHRLDRPVSGLLVFARTSKAAARLQKEFTSGRIKKFYLAVVETGSELNPGWNKLENFLERDRDITYVVPSATARSEKAVLYYNELLKEKNFSLILIKLDTGKKHQIRAQLSGIGKPVAGDKKYGSKNSAAESILLHSAWLSFKHPVKDEIMQFYSAPPAIFRKFIEYNSEELAENVIKLAENFPVTQVCRD